MIREMEWTVINDEIELRGCHGIPYTNNENNNINGQAEEIEKL